MLAAATPQPRAVPQGSRIQLRYTGDGLRGTVVWNNADRGGGRDRRPHKRALATKRKLLGGGRIVGKRHFRDVPREAQKLTAANRLFGTVRLREMETR